MSISLKLNKLNVKDSNGVYHGVDAVTDKSTEDRITEIAAAATQQMSAIEQKGEETLASIPPDYTELSETKMERYVIRLVKNADGTFKMTSLEDADLTFTEVYNITRKLSEYVVVVYGSSKLRPQYVSTNEMMFIGLDRSTETKVLRILYTPTRLTYETFKLAEYSDLEDTESRLSESILEISKYNAVDVSNGKKTYISRTIAGVTFTWDSDHTECIADGTSTGTAITNVIASTSELPSWLEVGKTYKVKFSTTSNELFVDIVFYISGVAQSTTLKLYSDSELTIPDNCTGIIIRLRVLNGHTAINAKATDIVILNTETNAELSEKVNLLSKSAWDGKTWYSFGTSMSDMNMDKITGNNPAVGSYPWVLEVDDLSGMVRTNKAIGSGGICPSRPHGGNVKQNIMQCPHDVDLITLECALNDWESVPLGQLGDKSNDSFIGNFTQCIEYLVYNTRAKVVLVTVPNVTFTSKTQTERMSPYYTANDGHTYRDVMDLEIEVCKMYGVDVIDADSMMPLSWRTSETVLDHAHLKEKGGKILGGIVWSKLKNMIPCPVALS